MAGKRQYGLRFGYIKGDKEGEGDVRRDFPNDAETKFREIKFHAKENICKNFLGILKFSKKSLRNVKNFKKIF